MTFDPLAHSESVGIEPELLSNLRQVAIERRITVQKMRGGGGAVVGGIGGAILF